MMKKTREFDNILNECLERVLIEGEAIEQCLASYPGYAAELEPLLQTALVTKKVSAVKPRPEFRDRARHQFRSALQEMEQKKERRFFFGWQPRWATAVIAVLVLVLASGGTVAAAGNSMPDEPLYQVKLATETVRLILTPSALGKAELYAKLADKRVAEIVYMADKGKPKQVERATQRLNAYLARIVSLAIPSGEEVDMLIAPPAGAAPEEMPAPAAERAPPGKESVIIAPPPAAAPREALAPPGQARAGKGGGIKIDKRAKLRVIVARNAVSHPAALRAALERVPEPVKLALLRAIAVSDTGYEKALKALD